MYSTIHFVRDSDLEYLKHQDLNFKYTMAEAFLHHAIHKQKFDYAEYLIQQGANIKSCLSNGYNCLLTDLIVSDKIESVKFVLSHGISVNEKFEGKFPVYYAVERNLNNYEMIKYLVSEGCICYRTHKSPYVSNTWVLQKNTYRKLLTEILQRKFIGPEVSEYLIELMYDFHWKRYEDYMRTILS